MIDKLGICQWFHYNAYADVERCIRLMQDLGIRHIRTGISWADYHRPGGPAWYDWQMNALQDFEVLLSIWHTPPSISENHACSGPPQQLRHYADFLDIVIQDYGHQFNELELWNEPNNKLKWDFPNCDPQWQKFSQMVAMAAHWSRKQGKRTVLGGIIPVDPDWLRLVESHGALSDMDIIAIHGFPEMWWEDAPNWDWYRHWNGWAGKVSDVAPVAGERPVWITETGLATWDMGASQPGRYDLQTRMLRQAAQAPADRVYWYNLVDLHPDRWAIEGFHVDENEYHLGLVTHDGHKKPAWWTFKELLEEDEAALAPVSSGAF